MASKKITMSLSEKTIEILEKIAAEKGLKKSAVVALAVSEYADRQKGVVHENK
ncbi:MAG: hypothetical protein OSJ62_18290 [Lachnospiraceae bacterium]|nr:hypothetical protein [Lachnospiraceae bacterium]